MLPLSLSLSPPGGSDGSYQSKTYYLPISGLTSALSWITGPDMPQAMENQLALTIRGRLLLFSGYDSLWGAKDTLELEPDLSGWLIRTDLAIPYQVGRVVTTLYNL